MTTDSQLVCELYNSLEDDFLKIIKYIPLQESHYNVWSFYLSSILLNTGSTLASFFKNSLYSRVFDEIDNIAEYRSREDHNMDIFRKVYKAKYKIERKKIYELKNFTSIIPYGPWNCDGSLDWWNSYTKIKHDRFEYKEKASLKATLDALGGLFLSIVIHSDNIPILVDNDVIKGGGPPKTYLKEVLVKGEPIEDFSGMPYYAKTKLFGYVYEIEGTTFTDENDKNILSPSYPGYGW